MSIIGANEMAEKHGPVVKTIHDPILCQRILRVERIADEHYKLLMALLRSAAEDRIAETAVLWDEVARAFGYKNSAEAHADLKSFRAVLGSGDLVMHDHSERQP